MSKETILRQFEFYSFGKKGSISAWLCTETANDVFDRLDRITEEPLSAVQFNQLLGRELVAPMSNDFFRYYWLENPMEHPYSVTELPDFDCFELCWMKSTAIVSLSHLKWGMHRLFVDALLYFGNIHFAWQELRNFTKQDLHSFFKKRRFDLDMMKQRGRALPLNPISMDDRYLISEIACKSFGDHRKDMSDNDLLRILKKRYDDHFQRRGGDPVTFRQLLSDDLPMPYPNRDQLDFLLGDILDESVSSEVDFEEAFGRTFRRYVKARSAALENTQSYLSMVGDLDVYVATSMRTRADFRTMATFCSNVFDDADLKKVFDLRYFDPTMSAAEGHEDKGLIECLMVKCVKVLVYCAGDKESYGKDAEAAMALSLGKPVIFYCDEAEKSRFYREIHPLSRLIQFDTGVAVGAIVTNSQEEVKELLRRLFENKMMYRIEHESKGYLRLKEDLTDSVVRIQTSDQVLSTTFWNHYHT